MTNGRGSIEPWGDIEEGGRKGRRKGGKGTIKERDILGKGKGWKWEKWRRKGRRRRR